MPAIFIEYELDSDDLDDDAVAQTNLQQREQSMPLLVGLLDASAVRRSLDIPMGVDCAPEYSDVDLEELVAKQKAGGGMMNSIANMANSILGAGTYPLPPSPLPWLMLAPFPKGSSVCHSLILQYSLKSEHFVRSSLRHESRRILHGHITLGRPFRRHRLDDTSHRHKRKAQRHKVIHRNHGSLFWLQWARCCVLLSILFCIRWYVCVP